ncbi:MAG: ABC transporter ATP-binding protein [Planctomycetota bacterium]
MIEAEDLCKSFGPIQAVDHVSFGMDKGDVLGFMGPNGAGKTTTMKMLTCFYPPDSGTASVAGHDVREEPVEVRENIGYLAENAPAYEEMTPRGFLKFCCDARGMDKDERADAIDRVAQSCAITDVMFQPIGTLSRGYRRRVGLAQAMVHDPPVLILDEPTDGLDPNQKNDVRELLSEIAAEKSILISTHILEEVDAICNRMIIIHQGRVLVDTTPEDLREEKGKDLDAVFRELTMGEPETTAAEV